MENNKQSGEQLDTSIYHIKSKKVSKVNEKGRFKTFAWVEYCGGTFISLRFHESFAGYLVAIHRIRQQVPSSEDIWKQKLKGNKILNFADNELWLVHHSKAKTNKVLDTDVERLRKYCNWYKYYFKIPYKPVKGDALKLNECKFWTKEMLSYYLHGCKSQNKNYWYLKLGTVKDFVQKENEILRYISELEQHRVNPYNFPDFDIEPQHFKPDTAYFNDLKDKQKRQVYLDFCKTKGWELKKILRVNGGITLRFGKIAKPIPPKNDIHVAINLANKIKV